jgi:hypothetical protein
MRGVRLDRKLADAIVQLASASPEAWQVLMAKLGEQADASNKALIEVDDAQMMFRLQGRLQLLVELSDCFSTARNYTEPP